MITACKPLRRRGEKNVFCPLYAGCLNYAVEEANKLPVITELQADCLFNTGFQSVENSKDLTLYTQTGFRIPFYKNLNITAQMNWDYDKSPAPGTKNSDYTYILSLGYLWTN